MSRSTQGYLPFLLAAGLLAACSPPPPARIAAANAHSPRPPQSGDPAMDEIARSYVRLVLAVGQHDANYVDAYYGPQEWRAEVEAEKLPLDAIHRRVEDLLGKLSARPAGASDDELVALRHRYLDRQLRAVAARVEQLEGKKTSFDEESEALYDAVAPRQEEKDFEPVLADLERAVPGDGPL